MSKQNSVSPALPRYAVSKKISQKSQLPVAGANNTAITMSVSEHLIKTMQAVELHYLLCSTNTNS